MSESAVVTINDVVWVKNPSFANRESKAIVRFIGCIERQIGTFYGVPLNEKNQNINLNQFQNMNENVATSNGLYFVKRKDIQTFEACNNSLRVTVGDIVNVINKNCHGIIRYIGTTEFKPDVIWYGIQLERPLGKNNGTVQGIKYFICEKKYGIFVRAQSIEKLKNKKNAAPKQKNISKPAGELSRNDNYGTGAGTTCCKYVKEEDLKFWSNRVEPPDL
eukprot:UN03607